MKDKVYISILNKIKHKQNLIQLIFPYSYERSFIFPYIINKDKNIKKDLGKAFYSLPKDNNIPELNTIIYKFVSYRLLSETKITEYYDLPLNWDGIEEWDFADIDILFEDQFNNSKSFNEYFKDILMGNFYKKEKDKNIHIKKSIIEYHFPKGKQLNIFIQDFFSLKEILFIPYDYNFLNLLKEIFQYLIDNKIHISKILFHKKYSEDYKNYLSSFINYLKEQDQKILNSFNCLLTIKFDEVPHNFKLTINKRN